jgi:hypothetical protein
MNRLELAVQAPPIPDWYKREYKIDYDFYRFLTERYNHVLRKFDRCFLLMLEYYYLIRNNNTNLINFLKEQKEQELRKNISCEIDFKYSKDDLIEWYLLLNHNSDIEDVINNYIKIMQSHFSNFENNYSIFIKEEKDKKIDYDWRFYWADEMIKRNDTETSISSNRS